MKIIQKKNMNDKSTEGLIGGLLASLLTTCGYIVGSMGAAIIIIIIVAIVGVKISDSNNKKKLKDFINNHKDLIDIINKRIKDANIIGKIDNILKLLDKTIEKVPGYELNQKSVNTVNQKVLNEYLDDLFVRVSKSGKLKEELKDFILDGTGLYTDFYINESKASKYCDRKNDEEYPDFDYRKIELDFKKSVLEPVNKQLKNYKLIFPEQGDDYIMRDDFYKMFNCYFNYDLSINLWDELKLDDIYDKIKDDLDNDKRSRENLYAAMYLMNI